MKTVGMIGSVSWQATIDYYRIINETVSKEMGGHHSAQINMACLDFETLVQQAVGGKWNEMADLLTEQVKKLEQSGSDFFIICANTIHKIAEDIASNVGIPILHIVDATAKELVRKNIKKVTLLGTKFTMEDGFYQDVMSKYDIEIMLPEETERDFVHKSIYEELVFGKILQDTKEEYVRIIEAQAKKGSRGVILGCTEIPLLVKQKDVSIPLLDTTAIHAKAVAEMLLV